MFESLGISRKSGITKTVYTLIKDKRYDDVAEILTNQKDISTSRAGLSILGYCFYNIQKFIEAANCYEQLCLILPKEDKYKLYYAQSLYQAGIFEEALKVTKQINHTELKNQVLQLQGAIQYSIEDYSACQATLQAQQTDTANDEGCLLYQAGLYEDALKRFHSAIQLNGFDPLVTYNIALCHFKLKQRAQSVNYISEILERAIRNYPELGIGSLNEADANSDVRNNNNSTALAQSGLPQALNLKAAIEYHDENIFGAREAICDLPPRTESDLDPITLHNTALTDPNGPGAGGLKKLAFLLELGSPICPKETFANILLLCCKHEMYDTAADILAEHADLTYKYLSEYLYELLDALITSSHSTEGADKKLAVLASSLASKLRTMAAKVQEARVHTDQNILRNALKDYEEVLDNYMPVVLSKAWLYWREDDFVGAEKEFRASAEFCSENPIWRLHAAHVLFMQGDKYKEAAAFYEPVVRNTHDILSVSAAVLANLCVSYIMTFQNEEAEELMRKVEKAEEIKNSSGENNHSLHLCIVNLVVGTLYCSKSNFEFGLSRIAHALEGGAGSRLCADTWVHVKRCILGLLASMAKQNVVLPYPAIQEILNFLVACEVNGLLIPSTLPILPDYNPELMTIGMEARKLRVILKKLAEYEK